jgi:hypothetical protein
VLGSGHVVGVSDDGCPLKIGIPSDQIARNANMRNLILGASDKLHWLVWTQGDLFASAMCTAVRENLQTSSLWKVQII